MIPAPHFQADWLRKQARQMNGCDPQLLERALHALALLGHLQEAGIPFVFRGGTSLLLHLPKVHRLSIDIDIVSPLTGDELTQVLAAVGSLRPFTAFEESVRNPARLPKRRHFIYSFGSALGVQLKSAACVLLDVVEHEADTHVTEKKAIRTAFLEPEREILVEVPTVESLLGDKLTAFAPATTGVPLRTVNGEPGDVMQVVKQLFDVGTLFEYAKDGRVIAETYAQVQALESGYRGGRFIAEQSLDDTIQSCLQLMPTQIRKPEKFPDYLPLWHGHDKLRSHLTYPAPSNHLRTLAARTAALAAGLRKGGVPDLAALRYPESARGLEVLKAASFKGEEWEWMDKQIKPTNPEAYHYWQQVRYLLGRR